MSKLPLRVRPRLVLFLLATALVAATAQVQGQSITITSECDGNLCLICYQWGHACDEYALHVRGIATIGTDGMEDRRIYDRCDFYECNRG